jgi:hypothetical protein
MAGSETAVQRGTAPAKETKAGPDGAERSLSVRVVPTKPGQSSSMATRWREGGRLVMDLLLGTTSECLRIHTMYHRNSNG